MATAVLAWAGKSFVSSVGSAAGSMAFDYVLSVIGIAQPTDIIRDQLTQISQTLAQVVQDIAEIDRKVTNLARDLKLVHLELDKRIEEKIISSATSNIQTHYTGAAESTLLKAAKTPLINLKELINKRKAGTLTPEMTQEFMNDIIKTWDNPKAVNQLRNGLLGVSHDDGILRAWTDLFVEQMGAGRLHPNLISYYQTLEQRFLSIIGTQLQGIYLVLLAKGYDGERGTVSPDAREYLMETVVPKILQPEVDRFLWCAEKLALSQGQWRSPSRAADTITAPVPGNTGAVRVLAGLGVPPDLGKVLFASEALSNRLMETFRDMSSFPDEGRGLSKLDEVQRSSGVYAHVICRNSDVSDQGPELKPWPEGAQRGRVLPATGILVPQWFGVDNGHVKLSRPERSGLRVARYFWPWYRIRGPFEQNFVHGKAVRDYALTEQQLHGMGIDWPDFKAMHAVDFSPLCRLAPDEFIPGPGAWTISPTTGIDKYTSAEVTTRLLDKPLMNPSQPFFRASLELKATQKFDSSGSVRTVESRTECPLFSIEHPKASNLMGHLWMSLGAYRDQSRSHDYHMSGQVIVILKTPAGDVELYDSDKFNGGKLRIWDKEYQGGPVPPQATDEPSLTFPIAVATKGKPEQFGLVVIARVLHTGYKPGASGGINWSIKEFAVSWNASAEASSQQAAAST